MTNLYTKATPPTMKVKEMHAVEGNTQKLDGGAMFGNAPKPLWERWIPADERNRIPLACRGLLIVTDDNQKILLETGIGTFFEPKLKDRFGVVESQHCLVENLRALSVEPEDITAVILSHLHFDHAGGMLTAYDPEKQPELIFKNARVYVGQDHWERARTPHPRDRASFIPRLHELLESSGNLRFVNGASHQDLSPLITFHFSNGHTPGLMLTEIHLETAPLIFMADLIPGLPWVHTPITMGYDRYPELLIEEKKQLLSHLLEEKGYAYFTHDPHTPCARIAMNDKSKFYGEPTDVTTLC